MLFKKKTVRLCFIFSKHDETKLASIERTFISWVGLVNCRKHYVFGSYFLQDIESAAVRMWLLLLNIHFTFGSTTVHPV